MSKINSGKATAQKMTTEERKARSMKGVEARKRKASMQKAIYEGDLDIGGTSLNVAVLDDERRIIRHTDVFRALGRDARGNARIENIPSFMDAKNLQPFVSEELREVITKVEYIDSLGKEQRGYDANILPLVADLYLQAREAKSLTVNQHDTAMKAEILIRSLAKVGIKALVDEATGYQDAREKDALAKIFEEFVAKELQLWIKTFPDDYYRHLFRLYDIPYPPKKNNFRPQFFGHVTNKVVYNKLAPELIPELKKQAKKGNKSTKLHQALTPELGHPKLREHLASIVTIMKLSKTKDDFFEMVDKIHPDYNDNYQLEFDE